MIHRLLLQALDGLRNAKLPLLWGLLALSLATFAAAGYLYLDKRATNSAIARLHAGADVAVDPLGAPSALLDARAGFLLYRDRIEDAQPLLDQALLRGDTASRVGILYNMANARMRGAFKQIEQGNFDHAIPLVMLAKAEYRNALRLDPRNWNAKYNLDISMRLVRDLPQAVGEEEEKPLETPEKLWTDLPGVPKGLP